MTPRRRPRDATPEPAAAPPCPYCVDGFPCVSHAEAPAPASEPCAVCGAAPRHRGRPVCPACYARPIPPAGRRPARE